jgi:dihydrofolate reductase
MKLTLLQFVSLDGVSQGPGSPDEDTSDGFTGGGWLVPHMDDEFIRQAVQWLALAGGLLLGRRTYEAYARDWPQITDPEDPFAERMNSLPKYVASQTLASGSWSRTTVLSGDVAVEVKRLKAQPGGELQIHGSARLAQSMLAAGLIDTIRLAVAPVVVGSGRRLFLEGGAAAGLRLRAGTTTAGGLTLLTFDVVGAPAVAAYEGVGKPR